MLRHKLSNIRLLKTISLLMQTKIFYPAHPAFHSQPPLTAKTLHWSQINTMLLEQKFTYLRELEKLHFTYQDNSSAVWLPVSCLKNLCYIPQDAFQTFPALQRYIDQRLSSFSPYRYKKSAEWRRLAPPWSFLPLKLRSISQLFADTTQSFR